MWWKTCSFVFQNGINVVCTELRQMECVLSSDGAHRFGLLTLEMPSGAWLENVSWGDQMGPEVIFGMATFINVGVTV